LGRNQGRYQADRQGLALPRSAAATGASAGQVQGESPYYSQISKFGEGLTGIPIQRVFFDGETYFGTDWADDWIEDFRPTSAKLQNLVDVLLSMFIRDKDGHAMLGSTQFDMEIVAALPSFANELTLRLSVPPKEVKPGSMLPELAAKLRGHISSPTLWSSNTNVPAPAPHSWFWEVPSGGGELRQFTVQAHDDQIRWIENDDRWYSHVIESHDDPDWPTLKRGYGTLW
jgi:hypothetical protein